MVNVLKGKYANAVSMRPLHEIESSALTQIRELMDMDYMDGVRVRIMSDVHAGKGCVIGFTAMTDADNLPIVPSFIGYDIGCGVLAVRLGKLSADDKFFASLDKAIRKVVPTNSTVHKTPVESRIDLKDLKCYNQLHNIERIKLSTGTLGGGNHFIEVGEDGSGEFYMFIHTGSRGLGKQVAEYYQAIADGFNDYNYTKASQEIISKYKSMGRENEIEARIKELKGKHTSYPKGLSPLIENDRVDYINDMEVCREYAKENRYAIFNNINQEFFVPNGIKASILCDIDHNHVEIDGKYGFIRKGSIKVKEGDTVVIPLDMARGCVIGVGNKFVEEWNFSSPHGAGRQMSRSKAKESVSLSDFKESMTGIFSTCINENRLDESTFAYKSVDLSRDLKSVDILGVAEARYNFKG